jgi:transcriptional regulator with XRE-family HTH domain
MPRSVTARNECATIHGVTANNGHGALTHFGRQMRKERQARGWSLREFAARSGIDHATASLIESGKRPPTERVARACDAVFPERAGWFLEWYEDSKSVIPPFLRSWGEHEDKAARIWVWSPGIIHGLLQTPDYARALIATLPGVTPDVVDARLGARIARQDRVLFRADPPTARFVIDELSLYRCVSSPAVMAAQMARLEEVGAHPHITLQVLPAVAHPATASELIIADDAAYCEHLAAGGVYTEDATVTRLDRLMTTIVGESSKISESLATIGRMRQTWTGVLARTPGPTAPVSKRRRAAEPSTSATPPKQR